ncbi:MAG: glycosyl hydrolase family 18 protein [Synergistaceae bacterium]|nr:glycosyl hydrolase family 18 protein [Synergistaceae bacterium]
MANRIKNILRISGGLLIIALACALFAPAAMAAEGDSAVEIYFDSGGAADFMGTAFYRAGALWVPAEALRLLGADIDDAPGGKGFVVTVSNPARAFDSPALRTLAGDKLSLSFPLTEEAGISYFNVNGMEKLLGLACDESGGAVTFRPAQSGRAYDSGGAAKKGKLPAGKLTLAWEHVTRENPDLAAQGKIKGLDVLSPTWFNLADANGGIANRASAAYSRTAREMGYSLWALVSNSFNAQMTTAFFKNARAQNLFIARLIAYAKLYGLDGINVDFEGMSDEHRDPYTRFFSRLASALRAEGLIVSVDVFIPANTKSSRSHNRAQLAKDADYLMLMAYDEHWRTSPRAGSVASLPWVKRAVEGTLAEGVPPSKLLLGVPFYMRRWEETKSGGGVKVKGSTLTMAEARALAAKTGAQLRWLENEAQHYFSYTANGKNYKIWVENAESLAKKLELVKKHGLAGMAGWRKGHEEPDIWEVVARMMEK